MMHKLRQLCQSPDHRTREEAICTMLDDADLTYTIPAGDQPDGRPRNIIVSFTESPDFRWIFGAHYDIDVDTQHGANDNSAAVIQLVQLAADLAADGYRGDLTICFWDLEEPSNGGVAMGATHFARSILAERGPRLGEFILVLDVCGVGDTIGISRTLFSEAQASQLEKLLQSNGHEYRYRRTPCSDNLGLDEAGLESVLATVLPRSEIDDRRPATWNTLHTLDDHFDQIEPRTMEMMRSYLRSWVETLESQTDLAGMPESASK